MDDTQLYLSLLIMGQILPHVTDIINKHVNSAKVRYLASWLMPLVISTAVNFNQLRFGSLGEWSTSLLILSASSQAAYKFWYEGSQWQSNIRFTSSNLPLKELIPPVEMMSPKLQVLKNYFIK